MAEFPKVVRERMRATAKPEPHPEPNLLAALPEAGLSKRERDEVMRHLARCPYCREVVAISLPELSVSIPQRAHHSGWLAWPVLRWGALAACVVVVGAAVTLRLREGGREFVTPARVQAPRDVPASAALDAPRDSGRVPTAPAEPARRKWTGTERTRLSASPASRPALPAPALQPEASVGGEIAAEEMKTAESKGSSLASNLATAENSDEKDSDQVPGRAKEALEEKFQAQESRPDDGHYARSMARSTAKAGVAKNKQESAGNLAVAPSFTPRWTLSSDGSLQRSVDSGRSWETITVSDKATFRALAANHLDIWVGGSAGALYHSSDAGQHWTAIKPVARGEALSEDIIGVEFLDPQHGKVTTSSQHIWITEDAGQSWQRQ